MLRIVFFCLHYIILMHSRKMFILNGLLTENMMVNYQNGCLENMLVYFSSICFIIKGKEKKFDETERKLLKTIVKPEIKCYNKKG